MLAIPVRDGWYADGGKMNAGYRVPRRYFIRHAGVAGLGLLAACGRLPGQTEPAAKVHRIGWLTSGPSESTALPEPGRLPNFDAFRAGLTEYGYVEGQNLVIEYRMTDQAEQFRQLTAELVQLPVEVIAGSPVAALAARQVTQTIPIVFVGGGDPVAAGLVDSLAHPRGNATGLPSQIQASTLIGKQMQLLKESIPGIARVGVLAYARAITATAGAPDVVAAATQLGLEVQWLTIHTPDELGAAFDRAVQADADGLLYVDSPLLSEHYARIAELALRHRLPAIGASAQLAREGGLMAYGTNLPALNRRAAYFVDRILKGTEPGDLPVEQPTTFDFIVNLKTAQALGLTIPQHVLLQATDVIR